MAMATGEQVVGQWCTSDRRRCWGGEGAPRPGRRREELLVTLSSFTTDSGRIATPRSNAASSCVMALPLTSRCVS